MMPAQIPNANEVIFLICEMTYQRKKKDRLAQTFQNIKQLNTK